MTGTSQIMIMRALFYFIFSIFTRPGPRAQSCPCSAPRSVHHLIPLSPLVVLRFRFDRAQNSKVFRFFDKDNNGSIDINEIYSQALTLGLDLTVDQVWSAVHRIFIRVRMLRTPCRPRPVRWRARFLFCFHASPRRGVRIF